MKKSFLIDSIKAKASYLCIGLDSDPDMLPASLSRNAKGVVTFNKAIIDATKDLCVSYKINAAFYEAMGASGWEAMEETVAYIPKEHFKIADAKRGDIGNTSKQYARAFFEKLNFDAITLHPYMGSDSIQPFLEYEDKWAILLALTSNKGADDFEMLKVKESGDPFFYEKIIETTSQWGNPNNLMFVTGATRADQLASIRKIIPNHFLLVPGVGAQGGSLADVTKFGANKDVGLLVNVSRTIIFAGQDEDYAMKSREAALSYQLQMKTLLT